MSNIVRLDKKILPMNYPPITSWTWHANLLSILTNYGCTYGWIYSNYIQLLCFNQGKDLFVNFIPRGTAFTDCPWIHNQFLKRDTISNLCNGEIVDFFVDRILENNYIYGVFDESIFLGRTFNKNTNKFLHELFIFGFDYETQTFDVADFTFKSSYSYEKVTFENIRKAYNNVTEDDDYFHQNQGGLILASFKNKAKYELDTILIQQTLKEFLNSQNTTERNRMLSNPIGYANFGTDVYDRMIEHFQLLIEDKVRYDWRPLHVLYDHKSLMIARIEYLVKNKLLMVSDEFINKYKTIHEKVLLLRNLFLKAAITRDKMKVEKVISGIKEVVIGEKYLMEEMIDKILPVCIRNSEAPTRKDLLE